MKLYDWCKDCMSLPEPVKAFVGESREEATLHLTKDSLLWKTKTVGGISLSSIKMVEAEDENTLSIGYASGTRIESVRIQLLDTEQFDWNKPLLKWYLHVVQGDVLTTSAMKVFQQYYLAYRRGIEDLFAKVDKSSDSFAEIDNVKLGWHRPVHMLNQLLERQYPILLQNHPKDEAYSQSPQRIHLSDYPKYSYEIQLNCTKLAYLIFMASMVGGKRAILERNSGTLYDDSEGMSPSDYEKLFLHYGLIEKTFLEEDFKAVLMSRSNVTYLEDANGPRPKDYKQWFLKTAPPIAQVE